MKKKQLLSLEAGSIIVTKTAAYVVKKASFDETFNHMVVKVYQLPPKIKKTKKNLTSPKVVNTDYFDVLRIEFHQGWRFRLKRYYNPFVVLDQV